MKEQRSTETHGAHSTVRSGTSDYHDGGNVTDWLGNDDQIASYGTFESGEGNKESQVGKVANGNGMKEDEEDLPEEGSSLS